MLSAINNVQSYYVSHMPAQLNKFYLATYEIKLCAVEDLHLCRLVYNRAIVIVIVLW